MKTGIIQQSNTANIEDNISRLQSKIRLLADEGAELVILQELHNGLYFCQTEDVAVFDQAETIPGPSSGIFGKLARETGLVIVLSLFEKELQDYITTQLSSSKKMAALQGYIAKCTFRTIRHIMKSFILCPVIWVLNPFRLRLANWGYWFAGINGIQKLPD